MDNGSDQAMYAYASRRTCNWIVNSLILCGNRWGFVQVGVYNKSFVQASSDTWMMFKRVVGLEELIDSDLTSSICFLIAIAIGAISALTVGIWVFLIEKGYLLELTLYAFIIGYFLVRSHYQNAVKRINIAFYYVSSCMWFLVCFRAELLQYGYKDVYWVTT